MIQARYIHVDGIGAFAIPCDTEAHADDGEKCVRSICGWRDPELARSEGAWGDRCGQEYSYLGRASAEDVRVVLDIGHNVGAYTVWGCRIWWPDTVEVVHAYDPNPGCAEFMKKNLALVQRGIEVKIHTAAVTCNPNPMFHEDTRWGCSWTHHEAPAERQPVWAAVAVRGVHPQDLPPADAIKIDAEGVEGDILAHYKHWGRVKVLQIEWHSHANRRAMYALANLEGFVLKKNDCGEDSQGVACWVRR